MAVYVYIRGAVGLITRTDNRVRLIFGVVSSFFCFAGCGILLCRIRSVHITARCESVSFGAYSGVGGVYRPGERAHYERCAKRLDVSFYHSSSAVVLSPSVVLLT